MRSIKEIIEKIKSFDNCIIYPPNGIPQISTKHNLPKDVEEFYTICGGIELFTDADMGVNIVSPERFVLANPVIIRELCEYDISSDWYIIVDDRNGEYLTIDLDKDRNGKCYDSHLGCHGIVGNCTIIATSFIDLLERLIETEGEGMCWYWDEPEFIQLGDAYDEINLE